MTKKIMVIDDEPDTIEAIDTVLEMEGYEGHTFTDAKKALAELQKGLRPDLILLDMRMPQISGPDFCTLLRKNPKLVKLRVCFFTASNDLNKGLLKKHGALGFVYKPFNISELVEQIEKYSSM